MMVGRNISDEQLGGIADRAICDADTDKDGVISFDELKRVSKYCMVMFVPMAKKVSLPSLASKLEHMTPKRSNWVLNLA